MTFKEITVSVGRTINLGNFESLRVDMSATATVDGDAPEEVEHNLTDWLQGRCRAAIKQLHEGLK